MHWASEDIRFRSYFKGVSFTHDIHTLKYELLPPRAYTTREKWLTANFTYLYANFTFVRKISGSLLNVYIPSTLVVFLSWTSFWIDVSAVPARITLGVTSLLTLVTQMIQARNNLPAISYMTAMDLWLFACLLQVFGSILAFTFTYRIYARTYKNLLSNTVHLFSILLISILNLNDAVTVETSLGKVIGSFSRFGDIDTYDEVRVHQFLGVPFAKPPIGNLRFKKPEPVEAWSEPLECRELKPACTQFTPSPFPWYTDDQENISEDCLYLNIYAPRNASAENKKAVLFWIYGGGFFIGSNRQDIYDGIALAGMGDIIVVTVNYRLGSLGFWFSNTDDAPGNVGIWDMLTALKWVNEHIESFGGDKSRITIAGESAGAISVGLLSVSPLTRGLYARQIMESGSPAYTLGDDNSGTLERSIQVALRVGCINESVTLTENPERVTECMRGGYHSFRI
ncbi:acetylcholinesterase-1 [Trichonephila inaurata madagascariensis]|uniref:Carboxylic ester hydrolase n=1 Tax=Trichonephila inaurata madagascariensis TaxID=2747483 RepID=A0A8X6XS95_9ARAC|nr:acetylcholinesterase-1 [Trichonephila inaurata madagascariensis]